MMHVFRKILTAVASAALLTGMGTAVASAATVPGGTPPGAVVHERNSSTDVPTWYTLADADPQTGQYGYLPLGDAYVYNIHWTSVKVGVVLGYGQYIKDFMGSYRSGPVSIRLDGAHWQYTTESVTLTESWYGTTSGSYPPYGSGTYFTTSHVHLAVDDPTLQILKLTPYAAARH